ncbi:MAG: response regulator [Ruminococcus sp.]|jgi:signal transduction histidine kinase/ActR/RegA family two-component response regulator|nr:response regulator [Ruminococcus sp.]
MKNKLLTAIRYIPFVFVILLFIGVGFFSVNYILEMSGNARIVNYAGIVRGGSQKLFKMETFAYYTDPELDREKRDKLTARLDNIIDCLMHGGLVVADNKELIKMHDEAFQEDMAKIRTSFDIIKTEITAVRNGKSPADLYVLTESYFELCDRTVGDSEIYSQAQVNRSINVLIAMNVLILVILIVMGIVISAARRNRQKLESLEKAALDAERENRAKSSFLANMSHEIRTPLNSIIGMASVADRSDDGVQIKKSVREILTASDHLLGVVNDILDISKIESGKLELASEPFNLKMAIDEVGSMIHERCRQKDQEFIEISTENIDVWVLGDKTRFKQVLINLLGNAVKFTPPEGKITLDVNAIHSDDKLYCRFKISDTGIGMTEEQTDKLFHSFSQVSAQVSTRFGGTGLGLAISRNVVRLMGGEIHVSSEPDKGSCFDFDLILTVTEPKEIKIGCDFPDLTGKHLLLVDDIEVNRMVVAGILEETGIKITEAEDGVVAVEKFKMSKAGTFDIIFMDTRMPIMDGYEAARRIRVLPKIDAATVPIISMSANAFREDIEAALNAGMNDYIVKPVAIDRLAEVLHKYFG